MILQLFGALALTILTTFNTIYQTFNEMNSIDNTIQQNESNLDIQKKPYQKLITIDENCLNTNDKYVFVAKNIDNNGLGVWYSASPISKTTSARFDNIVGGTSSTATFDLQLGNDIQTRTTLAFTSSASIEYVNDLPIPYNYLSLVWLSNNGGSALNLYYAGDNSGFFDRSLCVFMVSNITRLTNNSIYMINRFFDVYIVKDSIFTFNSEFNYNAPYGYAIESPFISEAYFTSSNPGAIKQVSIDLPFFVSNDYIYNQIKLTYFNAYGTRYYNNGDYLICETEGFGYYSYMEYWNTFTNSHIVVNMRVFGTYTDNADNIQTYLAHTSQWKNVEYQTLNFVRELQPNESNKITIFNTTTGTGYNNSNTTDIGLGNVFTLISSAFGAIGGFLSIQIFPGLSLGLLLFAPLVVGIIIAVVWIVKR